MADQRLYVQAQPFTLYGSGASIGDSSLTLTTFNGIDGVALTMADFGTLGYGTIEPGNSTQEEQISWTGVTTNSNGSVSLTGVQTVGFKSPYTSTANIAKSHAGATRFVITNTAGFYDSFANKNNDETINQTWTFVNTKIPQQDSYLAPTTNAQFAPKKYVDDIAIAGAPTATTATAGIVKLGSTAQTLAGTGSAGGYGLVPSAADLATNIQSSTYIYFADAAASDTYVITPVPAIAAYANGQRFIFKANTANTGAATLNVNGKGAITIKKYVNGAVSDLETNDILAATIVEVVYNGGIFQKMGPQATDLTSAAAFETQTFFENTAFSATQANTLTAGISSDATALHLHKKKVINSSRTNAAGSGTQTISGVGFTPHLITISVTSVASTGNQPIIPMSGTGSYDGTTQGFQGIGGVNQGGSQVPIGINSTTQIILLDNSDSGGTKTFAAVAGNIGVDGFDLVWTLSGSALRNATFTIVCEA